MATERAHPRQFRYRTSFERIAPRAGTLSSDGKPALRIASPPEFKGEPGVWSPEDLLVAAVESCTMTTFISVAERENVTIRSYASTAEGLLESVDGVFRFSRIVVRPRVVLVEPATEQLGRALFETTHRRCFITSSVRCDVLLEPVISIVAAMT